jgi:hypothetical protein
MSTYAELKAGHCQDLFAPTVRRGSWTSSPIATDVDEPRDAAVRGEDACSGSSTVRAKSGMRRKLRRRRERVAPGFAQPARCAGGRSEALHARARGSVSGMSRKSARGRFGGVPTLSMLGSKLSRFRSWRAGIGGVT